MQDNHNPDRRSFFGPALSLLVGATLAFGTKAATRTADNTMPHVSIDSDPTAKMLGYTENSAAAPAPHQQGQACANCRLFDGGTPYGPCRLYPGKLVNANGWCAGYAAQK